MLIETAEFWPRSFAPLINGERDVAVRDGAQTAESDGGLRMLGMSIMALRMMKRIQKLRSRPMTLESSVVRERPFLSPLIGMCGRASANMRVNATTAHELAVLSSAISAQRADD